MALPRAGRSSRTMCSQNLGLLFGIWGVPRGGVLRIRIYLQTSLQVMNRLD